MTIEEVLASIKSQSLKVVVDEFKDLLDTAKKDKSAFIKTSAEQLKQALIYLGEGKLSPQDVSTLLKKQKKIAQIEANDAQIQLLSRIQKVTYRLLDIALDVLLKAVVPA
jgi:hypothetical protein